MKQITDLQRTEIKHHLRMTIYSLAFRQGISREDALSITKELADTELRDRQRRDVADEFHERIGQEIDKFAAERKMTREDLVEMAREFLTNPERKSLYQTKDES